MSETRILKINNCFECKYNTTVWLHGYVCKLTSKNNAPWCWEDEFPPHCRLLETDDFLDRENKRRRYLKEIFT